MDQRWAFKIAAGEPSLRCVLTLSPNTGLTIHPGPIGDLDRGLVIAITQLLAARRP